MAGTDKSRSTYRGLLLMDPRITGVVASGDATYSTDYTQAGEAYDTPVPTAVTDDLVLQASGTPEVAAQTFTVTTQRSGFPGRDKAGFIWERATDAHPFGWEHPNVTAGWEAIQWTDGGNYPATIREPDAVTLSDGTVIVCCGSEVSAGVFGIITYTRNPSDGVWGSFVTVVTGTSNAHPCMVVLPDDRVLLFYWLEDTFNSVRSITAYSSADAGATWNLHSHQALQSLSTATYTWGTRVGRLRACYLNGDIALFGWLEDSGPDHFVFQWASADLGGSFTLVTTIEDKMYPDCVAVDGTILLAMLNQESNQGITLRRIGTAFQPASTTISTIDPLAGDDFASGIGSNVAGDLTIWADEDGSVYVANLIYSGANKEGLLWRSYDAGLTWENVGQSALGALWGTFWVTADSTPSYPTGLVGTHCRGSQVILHNWIAPVGNEDNSLAALWLGGYSTVTNPFSGLGKYHAGQVSWSEMYLPYELPSDVDVWTVTSTGTESITNGALLLTTTAQVQYNTATPTTTPEQGIIVQWEVQCPLGGSSSSELVAMRAIIGDGSHGYGISVRMSTTAFRAYDHFGGPTALGAGATTVDLDGSWIQFRLYMHSPSSGVGAYALYYRLNTAHGLPRAWTLAVSGVNLTDAGGATTDQVRWGILANATALSRWRGVFYTAGSLTKLISDIAASGGQDSPDDLNRRDYAPVAISVADGLKIRAVDGPTFLGSEWTIPSRYEYAIEKILPSVEPSPLEGWRSSGSGTMKIDFELAAGDTEPLNDTIGLYIQGHNWRVGILQKWDGGSWSTIASFDLASDTGLISLTYIHNNGAVRPGTGTEVGSHYFQFNELAGGVISFSSGAKPRRILGNTEGFWQAATSGVTKQVTIWFDSDGSEPSSGTDLTIVPPQALIVAHLGGINYRAYRLQISGTYATPEGYYTLNTMVLGPMVVFGKDSDWGRKYGLEPITTIIENANGNRRSRKMNTPRRSVELPWTDGIDVSQVSGSTAASAADYLLGTSTSGGQAIALRHDTAWQLEGVVNYTGGGHLPVVYCPKFSKGTPDSQIHILRRLSMYGRIVSDWTGEVVVGDEETATTGELLRVAGLTIEEEK